MAKRWSTEPKTAGSSPVGVDFILMHFHTVSSMIGSISLFFSPLIVSLFKSNRFLDYLSSIVWIPL